MRKIINPCKCLVYTSTGREEMRNAFVKIEYKDSRLSICGVVAPMRNGNCLGSAGQCTEEIRGGEPTDEWTREMLDKLCDIWDRWHLNDMRPYCEHQKELGWDKQSQEKVKITKWDVTREARDKAKDAEKRALECLKNGETFIPTSEETMYANVGYGVTTYNDELPEHPEFYEFKEKDCLGHSNVEYKTRGWIRCTEHELGLLTKECPVCGYKYGTSWKMEEIPSDVIEWLESLPETKIQPAWV